MSPRRDFFEPLLPFPLRTVQTGQESVEVYEIAEEQKGAVLGKLYPFCSIPRLESLMEDGHHNR